MSKQIKQLEMDALKSTFQDVRDMVLLTATGIDATLDNQMRLGLRKKNIRLQIVKNSLVQRVFGDLGMKLDNCWDGPTIIAWGGSSVAELSRELDGLMKKNAKIKAKTALCEGQVLSFERAKSMPTRIEALGRVASLMLAPAGRVVSQLRGVGGRIAGQVKTLSEKPPADTEAPAAG
jgi:large subunit ribosomal protein L10